MVRLPFGSTRQELGLVYLRQALLELEKPPGHKQHLIKLASQKPAPFRSGAAVARFPITQTYFAPLRV